MTTHDTIPIIIEIVYCKHGYRGNCPHCGSIIILRHHG